MSYSERSNYKFRRNPNHISRWISEHGELRLKFGYLSRQAILAARHLPAAQQVADDEHSPRRL